MKTRLIAMFGILALVAACSGGAGALCGNKQCPSPKWTMEPPALSAIGSSKGINAAMAKKMATDSGRHELARMISAKMMGVLDQSAQQVVGANPGEVTGHQYAEEITRTLHKHFLSGSRATKYYYNCCSGEWMALVQIDKDGLTQAANLAAQMAAKKILKGAEKKHKQLSRKMEDILDKEFPNE